MPRSSLLRGAVGAWRDAAATILPSSSASSSSASAAGKRKGSREAPSDFDPSPFPPAPPSAPPEQRQQCPWCEDWFVAPPGEPLLPGGMSTRVARHLQACEANPENRCTYCTEFVQMWEKGEHERSCVRHPDLAPRSCPWCGESFAAEPAERHRLGATSEAKLARHLQSCAENREHACRHCAKIVPEWDLGLHERECPMHPDFRPQICPWCYQRFEATAEDRSRPGFATAQLLEAHQFGGFAAGGGGCPRRPRQGPEAPGTSSSSSSSSRARSHDSSRAPGSRGAGARVGGGSLIREADPAFELQAEAGAIIANILDRLSHLDRDERRKALRALQLQYHPDKCRSQAAAPAADAASSDAADGGGGGGGGGGGERGGCTRKTGAEADGAGTVDAASGVGGRGAVGGARRPEVSAEVFRFVQRQWELEFK